MKEQLIETLRALTSLHGAPGFEQPVVRYLAEQFAATGASIDVDEMGNLYATLDGEDEAPHLMVAAHSDEIGAVVRAIHPDGFLSIDPIGGLIPTHLVAQRVRVGDNLGVVGVLPGHVQSAAERRQVPEIHDLFVDIGARSAEEVAAMGIAVGTPVTYDVPLAVFGNGERLTGKAIDNRLGCAVLLQLFRQLEDRPPAGPLTALVAVQEEVGFRGATVGAHRVQPDYAIVVDTFPIGDTPGVPERRMPGRLGEGPVLVVAASSGRSGRGHITHPRLQEWLEGAAQRAGVPLQKATSIGIAISDAAAIHLSGRGVATGVLGLPRRYSHSPVCTFDVGDALGAVRVLVQVAGEMAEHQERRFI
ncbi:MAG: M20/M25/M40 family metallo-hydrolase [Candidatus Promineifilaceae bacterium]|nr:M20/M25/M40 family metallo-hydrolase [Candidatus Promineifilaceae bacterium]